MTGPRHDQLAAMLELGLGLGALLSNVRNNPTLPLEVRETAHALFARAIVERIRLTLECSDFLFDGFRRVAIVAEIKLCERARHLHSLPVDRVGRSLDVGDLVLFVLRHRLKLPVDLVTVHTNGRERGAIRRIIGGKVCRRAAFAW